MRILIADDEPLARSRLIRLLAQLPHHECIAAVKNAAEALAAIKLHQPDVILLDIAMPDTNGVVLGCEIQQLPMPPAVIFVTAHSQHALDAYQAGPADYILKPVSLERLEQALTKVGSITRAHIEKHLKKDIVICYQLGQQQRQIKLADVYYFCADQKYTRMLFAGGEALIDQSLTQLEQKFPHELIRIHRNCLINKQKFKSLVTSNSGSHYILLDAVSDKLEVSRRALTKVKLALQLD